MRYFFAAVLVIIALGGLDIVVSPRTTERTACSVTLAYSNERTGTEAGKMQEVPDSEFEIQADFAFLAMGFVSPVGGVLEAFGVAKDPRGNASANTEGDVAYHTNVPRVFAAGDIRRGQSLVVWAIREGRQCARAVDEFLMGESVLPR